MPGSDIRPLFTTDTNARVHGGLKLADVPQAPSLVLDPDTLSLLRDGLGQYEMEVKWLVHLDSLGRLRLWRSWTGYLMYDAICLVDINGRGRLTGLKVEQHPDRYRGSVRDEPGRFENVLIGVVNLLRELRAGHGLYGPVEGADPRPPHWSGTRSGL